MNFSYSYRTKTRIGDKKFPRIGKNRQTLSVKVIEGKTDVNQLSQITPSFRTNRASLLSVF